VETNLVFFLVDPDLGTAKDVAAVLKQRGVLVLPTAPQKIRACTHLDVSAAQAERASDTIRKALRKMAPVR
jgi:threonine aldolase